MHRIAIAFRAFFVALFNATRADQIERALNDQPARVPTSPPQVAKPSKPAVERHEALHLLAAMQREARFIDFIQEDLTAYSDAQIGAAVRDVHRDCRALLERTFALRPLLEGDEGSPQTVPAGYEAARIKLVGKVTGEPPFAGRLTHHGWQATRVDLPEWTGTAAAERVIAPAEVELK